MINISQLLEFNEKGYLVIENAINNADLQAVKNQLNQWTDESRSHKSNYGRLINGQPRFDLEPGHTKQHPKLRRITNPIEVCDIIKEILLNGSIPELLIPILGEDIKFDHCKINAKYPGMKAQVKYHQDHIFEPQSNDSVVVALLMLDDTNQQNGCLKIVPGSHKTKYSHTVNGVFTGSIDDSLTAQFNAQADLIEAKAGSLCLMHTWAVHGSSTNFSSEPRRLLIAEYKSSDAFPLTTHKLPSRYMDAVICGNQASIPRYRKILDFEVLEFYQGDSIFDLQDIVKNNTDRKAKLL